MGTRLTPALMSAATHGLIRTSHAVRSLSAAETPQRRYELAQGLGFWAATYYTLPGKPSSTQGTHTPKERFPPKEMLGWMRHPTTVKSLSIAPSRPEVLIQSSSLRRACANTP